jgi:type IX secretion system PorP/SprF family membrane protein
LSRYCNVIIRQKSGFSILFLVFLLIQLGGNKLIAQDLHFAQYNASPLNLNPAQTGLFNGDWRFVGNYRNQWKAIPVPYNTFSFSADNRMKMPTKRASKKTFSDAVPTAGIVLNTDKAGDSKLQTTQVYLSVGYIKKLKKTLPQFVSIGVQPGFVNKSFSKKDLTFDRQYDGNNYNPDLATGEDLSANSFSYFDIGAGVAYYLEKNKRKNLNVGFSTLHLNTPKQSFFTDKSINLDMKFTFSAIAQYQILPRIDLLPTFLYLHQGKYNEFVVGLFGKYHLRSIQGQTTAIALGGFIRTKDAFVIAANMDYRSFNVGISYDINTSDLTTATNNRGAFELSIIYILKKIVPFNVQKHYCPIYM